MPVHTNSIDSKNLLKVGGRHDKIMRVYEDAGMPLTDRQVKTLGGFDDMNEVRPRITELISAQYGSALKEIESIYDPKTNRNVRRTMMNIF